MWRIPVHELYAYPKVTQKLLEDARIDVEAWLTDKAVSKFSRKENNAFLVGNGINKPRGLLDYDTSTTADDTRAWGTFQHIITGAAAGFGTTTNGSDKLLDLIYEVKAQYRQNGKFLAARRTVGGIRKLKDGQGNYAYGLGLREGALVETIFGYGVVDGEDMPAYTTDDSLAVAFGDFAEAYTIVDRLGVAVVRDNVTQPGFVKYNMRKRVGGGAVNFEAVKFLKFAD
jgi:HK97 family phage major capsid protein